MGGFEREASFFDFTMARVMEEIHVLVGSGDLSKEEKDKIGALLKKVLPKLVWNTSGAVRPKTTRRTTDPYESSLNEHATPEDRKSLDDLRNVLSDVAKRRTGGYAPSKFFFGLSERHDTHLFQKQVECLQGGIRT